MPFMLIDVIDDVDESLQPYCELMKSVCKPMSVNDIPQLAFKAVILTNVVNVNLDQMIEKHKIKNEERLLYCIIFPI